MAVIRLLILVCLCLAASDAWAEVTVVRYPTPPAPFDSAYDYFSKVLDLALAKTADQYGPYVLRPIEFRASNPRLNRLLEQGREIDVLLAAPNRERHQRFTPVPIPLDKGLLGYRVMMIRPDSAPAFAAVRTLEQLKEVRLGQGADWEDWYVLSYAGFEVDAPSDFTALLDMLVGGRFHGFPRGVYEIDKEVALARQQGYADVEVERTVLIRYQLARIAYVRKGNEALATRLEVGLRTAIADGSFDRLFYGHPMVVAALKTADLRNRRVFDLPNPRFPDDSALSDPSLWYLPPVNAVGSTAH